jgi:translation initiation factor IF-2
MAVRVVGLSGLPESGLVMAGCEDERQARKLAEERAQRGREQSLQSTRHASLDDLFRQIEEEARKDLKVVVKADVQGTAEAVVESLVKLNTEKIKVDVIHAGVGAITENDILLAAASDAIVIGFHVRVNPGVNRLAQNEGVEIRLYSIIYELIDQVREAMEGLLAPEKREVSVGNAEILKIFDLSRGKICGCKVSKGVVKVGAHARVLRAKELIYNGMVQSLRRFTDDVKEVATGFECGIRMDNFADFEPGDIIEVYEIREEKAKL